MSEELQDILEQYRAMKEQRDELLTAMQELVTLEADGRHASESSIEPWERARAALAKATGEPPCAA